MKIKFVYKILPVFVFYTNRFLKDWVAGTCYGPYIIIKPEYKNKEHILKHELIHSKQFYRTFSVHKILYYLSANYRIKAELEAYTVQVKERNYSTYIKKWVAKSLFNHYNTKKTLEELEQIVFEYYR